MSRKSRKNVGLIGLGIIGQRVAASLRAAGFHVYVWNRTPLAEPNFLSSPADVADVCDVIQLFVSDAQALFSTIQGMTATLGPKHTIICSATVGPEATLKAAKMVEMKGAKFLDAPFTGSKEAAEKRELVYYIGGDDATLGPVESVLKASSKAILNIGEIGQAATIKIATNMIAAVTVQTLAEALAIVTKSGIRPEVLGEALKLHGVRSSLSDLKLPKMIHRDFEPHFSLKHMFKDLKLAIHVANTVDIHIPATTATAAVMFGCLSNGMEDLDFSSLVKVYEDPSDYGVIEKEADQDVPDIKNGFAVTPSDENTQTQEVSVQNLTESETGVSQETIQPMETAQTDMEAEPVVVETRDAAPRTGIRRWFGGKR